MDGLETDEGLCRPEADDPSLTGPAPDLVVRHAFDIHYGRLVQLARTMVIDVATAEELVQESFARTWAKWDREGRTDDPVGYLWRTVTNLARGKLRRRRVRQRPRPLPVERLAERDPGLRAEVVLAVSALPRRQRDVVGLRFYLDLSVAQIAEALGITEGTVKTHLHRAAATLRSQLGGHDG